MRGGGSFTCESHPDREAVGYCCKCGRFLCNVCVVTARDPFLYCEECYGRHVGPVPIPEVSPVRELQQPAPPSKVREDLRSLRTTAYRVEVHYQDGHVEEGTTYAIRPDDRGFFMVPFPPDVEAAQRFVKFEEMKAAFLLKNPDEQARGTTEREFIPEGHEITVYFRDGDMLDGFALGEYSPDRERFHVIPRDERKVIYVSVLVERSAVDRVQVGRVFRAKELRQLVTGPVRKLLLCCYIDNMGAVADVEAIAEAIGRTARIVDRELGVFIQEGLMQEVEGPPQRKVKFLPPPDEETSKFIADLDAELHEFYVRQQRLGTA